jgi:hypothetical protein
MKDFKYVRNLRDAVLRSLDVEKINFEEYSKRLKNENKDNTLRDHKKYTALAYTALTKIKVLTGQLVILDDILEIDS